MKTNSHAHQFLSQQILWLIHVFMHSYLLSVLKERNRQENEIPVYSKESYLILVEIELKSLGLLYSLILRLFSVLV